MKNRCFNPKAPDFERYGGRGIRVCERWRTSFTNFLSDMGERPEGTTLDRIDNEGDYDPGNCRWADILTQQRNTRVCIWLTVGDETKTIGDWARHIGLGLDTLMKRYYAGWDHKDIVSPSRHQGKRGFKKA
jgi:hypothetical protein